MLKTAVQFLIGFAVAGGCWTNAHSVYAQDALTPSFPYWTKVGDASAIVRSGPGEIHYGTDQLAPGTEIQIHRHDPGGWMAIRPPQASFSLVQRDDVELLDNGMARVIHNDTVAWVGTRLDPVDKPMWQVKLRSGELLKVLGQVDRDQYELGVDEPDWIQVEPPPGEFRWIAAGDLAKSGATITSTPTTPDRERKYGQNLSDNDIEGLQLEIGFESDLSGQPSAAPSLGEDLNLEQELTITDSSPLPVRRNRGANGRVPFDAWDEGTKATPDSDQSPSISAPFEDWSEDIQPQARSRRPQEQATAAQSSRSPADDGWRPAQQTISNFVNQRSSFSAEAPATPAQMADWSRGTIDQTPVSNASVHTRSDVFDSVDSAPVPPSFGSDFSSSATRLHTPDLGNPIAPGSPLYVLDQRLTQEMLKPPAEWNLIQLAAEVQRARNATTAPDEIAAADRMLEKIRKCREIQAGFRATDSEGPVDLETRRAIPARDVGIANSQLARNELHYDYDASGYLNELVRNNGVGPVTYVLQDVSGKITHQVTAPPGLNLRRYLNQRVGIIGNRGFNQQLNLDQVTADRVIAIDTLRR